MDYICNPSCCPMRSSIACGKGTMRFFQNLIPAGEPGMRFFWDKFQQHPCMELATWTSHPSFPHKCIPLGLHGDAVPTTGVGKVWAKMQLCFSWNNLLKIGGTKATNFLIWSVPWLVYTFTGVRLLSSFPFSTKKTKRKKSRGYNHLFCFPAFI